MQLRLVQPINDLRSDNAGMTDDVAGMLSALCQATGKSFDPKLTLGAALAQINDLRDKLDFQSLTRSGVAANLPGKVTSNNAMSSDGDP